MFEQYDANLSLKLGTYLSHSSHFLPESDIKVGDKCVHTEMELACNVDSISLHTQQLQNLEFGIKLKCFNFLGIFGKTTLCKFYYF